MRDAPIAKQVVDFLEQLEVNGVLVLELEFAAAEFDGDAGSRPKTRLNAERIQEDSVGGLCSTERDVDQQRQQETGDAKRHGTTLFDVKALPGGQRGERCTAKDAFASTAKLADRNAHHGTNGG